MLFADGQVALVTGGSRGIGRAISLDLAREGATVVLNYVKNEAAAAAVVDEIEQTGRRAKAIQADVSVEDDVRRLFRTIRRELGTLHVVVNNAGIAGDGFLALMSLAKWRHVMSANLDSVFLCSREALRMMARNKGTAHPGGAIVNVSSLAGIVGNPGQGNYSASKGGVITLTKSLAKEAAVFGVRANAVAPGFIATEMIREVPREVLDGYVAAVPLGRIGDAEEVASVVSFLASSKASYVTGQAVAIDGGWPH